MQVMTLIMKRNRVAQVAQSNQSLLEVCPSLSAEAESHALEHRAAKCVWVLHNPEDWLPGKNKLRSQTTQENPAGVRAVEYGEAISRSIQNKQL